MYEDRVVPAILLTGSLVIDVQLVDDPAYHTPCVTFVQQPLVVLHEVRDIQLS